MEQRQILLSGDYWHPDFKSILSSFDLPVTMVPIEKLSSFEASATQFDLIVMAESRRDQIQPETMEWLRQKFSGVPIVNLLGSWCEGEMRSGSPLPGVIRVYWHQWSGQYAQFVNQLKENSITDWHLPATTTIADRLQSSTTPVDLQNEIIGVSAWTQTQYEMLADSLKTMGYRSRWLERSTWDAEAIRILSAICIDANSMTQDLTNRLQWLKTTFPQRPMILILNFPRENDVASAKSLGVEEVLSKPFDLADLLTALIRVCDSEESHPKNSVVQ